MGRGRGSRDKLSITRTRGVSLARRHSGKKRARKRKTNDEIDAGAVAYERCKRVADDNRRRPDEKDPRIILPNNCISFRRLPLASARKKLPPPPPLLLPSLVLKLNSTSSRGSIFGIALQQEIFRLCVDLREIFSKKSTRFR